MATPPLPPGFLDRPIAHRGLHDRAAGCMENSPAAFAAAVAAGYGIECDVQLSADGEAMVFHDATLDRLTGERGPVRACTAADLGRLALTGSTDTIPTLGALLAQVGGRVPLVVEIKDQGGTLDEAGVGPLEARVAAVLAGYTGPVAVMSFNPASVAAMARLAPALPRGLVAGGDYGATPADRLVALRAMTAAEGTGSAFVSVHHRELPSARSAALRAAGLAVLCWTIRSAADAQTVAPHADAITFEGFAP
jgi:glycerophosphoryl diester phosphodiesterase